MTLEEQLERVTAERDGLRAQLDKIESQRARWRESKRLSRRLSDAPARFHPDQTSIYGDEHRQELLKPASPK